MNVKTITLISQNVKLLSPYDEVNSIEKTHKLVKVALNLIYIIDKHILAQANIYLKR